ncbi:MAG: Huntingtin interacting protein E-like protein [Labilithrix sp.]|nr:Huntingtin interacting protein E-like protein [Labilithrix sp.]
MAAKVSAKTSKKESAARSTTPRASSSSTTNTGASSGASSSSISSPSSSPGSGPGGASKTKRKLAVAILSEPPPKQLTVEERWAALEERLARCDAEFQRAYRESLDMSWIYHDSALEGSVYTPVELRSAVDPPPAAYVPPAPPLSMNDTPEPGSVAPISSPSPSSGGGAGSIAPPPVGLGPESNIQPISEEIRRHREALDYIRDYASKKRMPITVDVVKKIYLILHPEEGDIKTVKYRKDIPQHRLYFHEYAPPDKITYKVRQILDWTNDPETRRTRSAVRIAARAHYDLLRVFPFTTDSGKVARLFMNLLLIRSGFPPAIVHSTERQRYYEALKGASAIMTQIVHEAIENNLASVEKLLEAHESKGYAVKV